MIEHVRHTSNLVYGIDKLRPMRHPIFVSLFAEKLHQALFIDRTADRKPHVMRFLGTILKGVYLYFCPLLALLSDVIVKFQQGDEC